MAAFHVFLFPEFCPETTASKFGVFNKIRVSEKKNDRPGPLALGPYMGPGPIYGPRTLGQFLVAFMLAR